MVKLICASIICLTISMNSHFSKTSTLAQSFQVDPYITSLRPDLNGNDIEWINWSNPEIRIETYVTSSLADPYGLAYSLRRGHYELKAYIEGPHTLGIRSKRVNTQIFIKGEQQQTTTSYKIYIPAHLDIVD